MAETRDSSEFRFPLGTALLQFSPADTAALLLAVENRIDLTASPVVGTFGGIEFRANPVVPRNMLVCCDRQGNVLQIARFTDEPARSARLSQSPTSPVSDSSRTP